MGNVTVLLQLIHILHILNVIVCFHMLPLCIYQKISNQLLWILLREEGVFFSLVDILYIFALSICII